MPLSKSSNVAKWRCKINGLEFVKLSLANICVPLWRTNLSERNYECNWLSLYNEWMDLQMNGWTCKWIRSKFIKFKIVRFKMIRFTQIESRWYDLSINSLIMIKIESCTRFAEFDWFNNQKYQFFAKMIEKQQVTIILL